MLMPAFDAIRLLIVIVALIYYAAVFAWCRLLLDISRAQRALLFSLMPP